MNDHESIREKASNLFDAIVLASQEMYKYEKGIGKNDVLSPIFFCMCVKMVAMEDKISALESRMGIKND